MIDTKPNYKQWIRSELSLQISDNSTRLLILTNVLTLILAIWQGMRLGDVIWAFWLQSVTIGAYSAIRIFTLKNFSTQNLESNGKPVPETAAGKNSTGIFFIFHYGFFHLIYAIFLSSFYGPISFGILGLSIPLIFNHTYSYFHNKKELERKKQNLGTLMFWPYFRILPMHFFIIFGSILPGIIGLIFFTLLKTGADMLMHVVEHGMRKRMGAEVTESFNYNAK
jgi:hypothetical protein